MHPKFRFIHAVFFRQFRTAAVGTDAAHGIVERQHSLSGWNKLAVVRGALQLFTGIRGDVEAERLIGNRSQRNNTVRKRRILRCIVRAVFLREDLVFMHLAHLCFETIPIGTGVFIDITFLRTVGEVGAV